MKHYYHYNRLVDYLKDLHHQKAHLFDQQNVENVFLFFSKRDITSVDESFQNRTPLMWSVYLALDDLSEYLIANDPHSVLQKDTNGDPVWYYCLKKSNYPPSFVYIQPYQHILDFSIRRRNGDTPIHVLLSEWSRASYNTQPFYENTFLEMLTLFPQTTYFTTQACIPQCLIETNNEGVRPIDLLLTLKTTHSEVLDYIMLGQTFIQHRHLQQTICEDISQFKDKSPRKM